MIVYLIYNLINGKCYVGQTVKTLEERWYLHAKSAMGKSHLPIHNAIRKYGPKAFMMGWLSHATSREQLNSLERHFIARYNSQVPHGYNRTDGGAGFSGYHTVASRQKMRKSHLGKKQSAVAVQKQKKKMIELWKSEEYRKAHSSQTQARLGKKNTEKQNQRISEAIKKHWENRRKG